jgi:Holliday junction resolvasome RuvABC DNA-binding subunit
MALDSAEDRQGGRDNLNPFQIAHNSLFTAREKIELLQRLKAEVTGAASATHALGFTPEEIDEAIAEVREGAQKGVGSETVLGGDY